MPDCYAIVNMNPRDPKYAQEVAAAIADAAGVSADRAIIRFDEVRKKAHVFVPVNDIRDLSAVVERLRGVEAIVDYAIVALPSEVGVDLADYPSGETSA